MLHLFAHAGHDHPDTEALYTYTSASGQSGGGSPLADIFMILIGVALIVLMVASVWRIFTKAGKPGWAAIVPFYNSYVLLKIVGKPGWWLVWYFIPIANIVIAVVVYYQLVVKCFGKGVGFLILLLLAPMVAYPLLAFGDAEFHAPALAEHPEPKKSPRAKRKPHGVGAPKNPIS